MPQHRAHITRLPGGQFRVTYTGRAALAADRAHAKTVARRLAAEYNAARAEYGY